MTGRDPEDAPRPTRPRPSLFEMWGRETVKDLALVLAAIPVIVCLLFVPVLATSGGSWWRLLGLLCVFVLAWLFLRNGLRRWVAAGDRGGDSPSRG